MRPEDVRNSLKDEQNRLIDLREGVRSDEGLNDSQSREGSQEHVGAELHPAEVASEFVQREIDLSMITSIENEISDVELAMKKLDDGTYGICEACGQPIEEGRLEALPAARFCLADEGRSEEKFDRKYSLRRFSE